VGISNTRTLGGGSSRTSAGEDQRLARVQSPPSTARGPAVDVSVSVPPASQESEPAGQQGPLQAPANEHVAEACPVLSRVNPRRGPTSGGDEIDLIVSNLPPTMKLFARFGPNITATVSGLILLGLVEQSHCADISLLGPYCTRGTLLSSPSRNPSRTGQRHTVSSTSTNVEPYGRSLASFEYEADSTKAFVVHLSAFVSCR
jgi:hypothetical protein